MGDFNDRPLSVVHRHLRNHFEDAFRLTGKRSEPTFALGPIRFKLDHIYVSPGVTTLDCWVKRDAGAEVASDHLPLVSMVEVEWPRVPASVKNPPRRIFSR
jgi:endonuclease/exonuclease/phosphatase family metal-dependent hydrolase